MTSHDNTPNAAKNKLVRDSFTIPKAEYAILNELKQRATSLAQPAKKSEILRAGIELLKRLSDKAFLDALSAVPNLKTGRPRKEGETDDEPAAKVGKRIRDKTLPRPAAADPAGAKATGKPERPARPVKPAKADKPVNPARAARVAARANKQKA
jgi:hypothetical protein